MASSSKIVTVENISKVFKTKYEEVYALRDISLDIFTGEYLSIMGPSGSGKSTLFNMIGALDRPTRGTVRIGNVSLPRLSSLELSYFRCRYVGYVFQSYNLIGSLSAAENVRLPITFLNEPEEEVVRRATEKLEYVGLGDRLHHRPDELSGGQQQRVAIARALANNPRIILADEPTANLDRETGTSIIRLFKKLSVDFNVTIITATHDHKMLANSDRVAWIKSGEIDRIKTREEMDITTGSIGGKSV